MKCDQAQDMMASSYMDGEATPVERRDVEAHLASCQACREFQIALQGTRDVLVQASRAVPGPGVWAAIEAAVEPRAAWWEGWFTVPRPAFVLASVLAVCFLAGSLTLTTLRTARSAAADEVLVLAFMDEGTDGQDIAENGFGSLAEEIGA